MAPSSPPAALFRAGPVSRKSSGGARFSARSCGAFAIGAGDEGPFAEGAGPFAARTYAIRIRVRQLRRSAPRRNYSLPVATVFRPVQPCSERHDGVNRAKEERLGMAPAALGRDGLFLCNVSATCRRGATVLACTCSRLRPRRSRCREAS